MELKERIAELIMTPLQQEGFDLVEIKLARYRKESRLQVFVDSDNGVKVDDCARLSRLIEDRVDSENLFSYGYVIEVSSPGLDRPLISARDFRRRIGETVQVTFNDAKQASIKGEVVGVEGSILELMMTDGARKVDLETVKMGRIIF